MASSNIALSCAPESFDFDLEIKNIDRYRQFFKPEQSQGFDELRIKFYSRHPPRVQYASEKWNSCYHTNLAAALTLRVL